MRHITFNGISTKDLGIFVESATIGMAEPRIVTETIPYMDGSYDFSRIDGSLHYDRRTLEYTFIISGDTAVEASDKLALVMSWLCSYDEASSYLIDEHFGNWAFTGVYLKEVSDVEYIGTARRVLRLTAAFSADPYMSGYAEHIGFTSSDLGDSTDEVLIVSGGDSPRMYALTTEVGEYDLTTATDFTITDGVPHFKHDKTIRTVFAFPVMSRFDYPKFGENAGVYMVNGDTDGVRYVYQNGAYYGADGLTLADISYYTYSTYTTSWLSARPVTYATKSVSLPTPAAKYRGLRIEFLGGSGTVEKIDTNAVRVTCDSGVSWTAYAIDMGDERL